MIGKTTIELFDAKTGKKEFHYEKKNFITSAVELDIAQIVRVGQGIDNWHGGLATRSFGGLLLFDKQFTENADNYEWPDAICVGYANREAHTIADFKRGNMNTSETGVVENGYKTVWDFSTSQANGIIRSVCLTNYKIADSPIAKIVDNELDNVGFKEFIFVNFLSISHLFGPLYYDKQNKYIYWICWDDDHKNIYKTKWDPYHLQRVQDFISMEFEYRNYNKVYAELVTQLPDMILGSTNYNTNFDYWLNGSDGYFYWIYFYKSSYGDPGANTGTTSILNVRKIKYSDESYAVGAIQTITLTDIPLANINNRTRKTCNGFLYWRSLNQPAIYIINLHDFTDVLRVDIGMEDETVDYDYIYLYDYLSDSSDGVVFAYRYYNADVSTTRYWRCGIIHSDGVVDYNGAPNKSVQDDWPNFVKFNGVMGGAMRSWSYTSWPGIGDVNLPAYHPFKGYIATINNLELPITKTDQQTMKISYALLDTVGDSQ